MITPFLAVADAIWLAAIGGVVSVLLAWIKLSADKHAKAAAVVQKDIHTLVNNQYGVQLKLGMELSEWKASKEPTPETLEAARLARHKWEEHQAKQEVVDSSKKVERQGYADGSK